MKTMKSSSNMIKRVVKKFTKLQEFRDEGIYNDELKVLVLGDDTFHLSRWIAGVTKAAYNMRATSHVNKEKAVEDNVRFLEDEYATIDFDVQLTSFETHPVVVEGSKYQRVVLSNSNQITESILDRCLSASKRIREDGGEFHLFNRSFAMCPSYPLEDIAKTNNMDVEKIEYGFDFEPCSIVRFYMLAFRPERIFTDNKQFKHENIYSSHLKVLVLGEDNFEFSCWLNDICGGFEKLLAVSLAKNDSQEVKSTGAAANVTVLKNKSDIRFNVSFVTFCSNPRSVFTPLIPPTRFDRIIIKRADSLSDTLFAQCLASSKSILDKRGEIHIFDRRLESHASWPVQGIANKNGMKVEELQFDYGSKRHPYSIVRFYPKPETYY